MNDGLMTVGKLLELDHESMKLKVKRLDQGR